MNPEFPVICSFFYAFMFGALKLKGALRGCKSTQVDRNIPRTQSEIPGRVPGSTFLVCTVVD